MPPAKGHDLEGSEGLLVSDIIQHIAEAEGTRPLELEPPLHEVIDTMALEALVATSTSLRCIRFTYRDWIVEVSDAGDVSLEDRDTVQ